jgi:predicted MFS family arabinose efflux permease
VYAASGASGFSLGLVVGGLLSEFGWRLTFLVPVPLALTILVIASRVIPTQMVTRSQPRHYDFAGAATITSGTLLVVYAIVNAPDAGWLSVATLGRLATAGLLFTAFVRIERRAAQPLVRLGVLRTRGLLTANAVGFLYFGSYVGFQFFATLYLQVALGWSPVRTALAFLPSSFVLPFLGPLTERLIRRYGTHLLATLSLLSFAAGYALFLRADADPVYMTMIFPTMLLIGLGWGLGFPALTVQATSGVADDEQGLAAALFNTSFQIGAALLVAIVSAVITTVTKASASEATGILDSLQPVACLTALVALAGAVLALVSRPAVRATARGGGYVLERSSAERSKAPRR